MSRYVYAIVRFVPDPLRGEFVNAGAIVGDADGSTWRAARREDLHAVAHDLPDEEAEPVVVSFLAELRRRAEHADTEPEATLEALRGAHVRTFQLSPTSAVVAESAEAALGLVMEKLVDRPAGRVLQFQRPPARPRGLRPAPWLSAVAAGVVVALGFLVFGSGEDDPGKTTELAGVDRLVGAAARTLESREPSIYKTFEPVGAAERAALADPEALRGGSLFVFAPQGKVVEARPALRFERLPRQTRVTWRLLAGAPGVPLEVTVDLPAGQEPDVVTQAWPEAWPSLAPGVRYEGELLGRGLLGEAKGRFVVERASDAEARGYEAQLEGVRRAAFGPLADLVKANLALRAGFLGDAERYARRYRDANPDDAVGRDTLRFVRARIAKE